MNDRLTFGPAGGRDQLRANIGAAVITALALGAIGFHGGLPRVLMATLGRIADRHPGSGVAADPSGRAVPAAGRLPAGVTVPPTRIGISLTSPGGAESFANIALGTHWLLHVPGARDVALPDAYLDKNGDITHLPKLGQAIRYLTSTGNPGVVTIKCTFSGKANIEVGSPSARRVYNHANELEVTWDESKYPASLNVTDVDPAQPPRDIDCRNAAIARNQRFSPQFLKVIKGFRVLRFMDWQNTNRDLPVDWAHRHTPESLDIGEADGVALEDMVALATLNHSDAWFNMPSRADDDYIRHFAQYVHDTLPRDRKVYVEYSNEVWNWMFPVSRHTYDAGAAEHLGSNAKETLSFSYAERLSHVMDIWAGVFADSPSRLIRVASGQAGDSWRSGYILGYKDLPRHVDAFAVAPYFDYDRTGNPTDLDEIFRRLDQGVDKSLSDAAAQKALAQRHGLRFVAYEAGQGIILPDVSLNERIQRDPRMHDAYQRYLDGWRSNIGDTIILFGTVFKIRKYGAWGLLEYTGQPQSDAPKFRAVQEQLTKSAN